MHSLVDWQREKIVTDTENNREEGKGRKGENGKKIEAIVVNPRTRLVL